METIEGWIYVVFGFIMPVANVVIGLMILFQYRKISSSFKTTYDPMSFHHHVAEPQKGELQKEPIPKRKPVMMDDSKAYHLEREELSKRKPIY